MLRSVTKRFIDYSTAESYAFGFYCDCCNKEWKSTSILFSAEGFILPLRESVRIMLWYGQHGEAYERANTEAMFHFNHCPVCDRWVCNACFHVECGEHTDLCNDCMKGA